MRKERYKKRLEAWLGFRDSGGSIRECFEQTEDMEAGRKTMRLFYTVWLILPGEEDKAGLKREQAQEWDSILFAVFAETPKYRRDEWELWERLKKLAQSFSKETERAYRLSCRPVPAAERGLVGREEELARIAKMFLAQRHVFLYGIGGIGKSAVARVYAERYGGQYDTVVYASCDGDLRELFADDQKIPVENMAFIPVGKRGERGWYVRHKLDILKRITDNRTLIIIDNLDVAADDLMEEVLKLPCHLLFTTRTDPVCFGRTGLEIRALADKRELLRLFSFYFGEVRKEEEADVEKLLERFGGHTLYVKLLAGHCAMEQIRPSRLKHGISDMKEYIFELNRLPQKEKQVLKNAALLPVSGMELEWFLRLSGNRSLEVQVQRLRQRGLIEFHAAAAGTPLTLHPLVRREVEEVLGIDWPGCWEFVFRFTEELKGFWDMSIERKMQFQGYILRMLEALPITDTRYIDPVFLMTDLLWQLGQWGYAVQYNEKLYQVCLEVFGCPHPYTARAAHQVATVWHNRHEKEKAAPWFEKTWLAYRDLPDKEPRLEALYQMKYNRYFIWKGEYEKAEACLLEAERIYLKAMESEEGFRTLGGFLINTYVEHTRVCIGQNKYQEALGWCRKGRRLAASWKEGGATKAYIYHDAAVVWKHLGNREKYKRYAKLAKKMAELFLVEGHLERTVIEQEWKECQNYCPEDYNKKLHYKKGIKK